ncbi:MAG: CsgG/HfaB family protein [Geminicoccaceae bacterium]
MNVRAFSRLLITTALVLPIVACAASPPVIPTSSPTSIETTATYEALRSLPAPKQPVPVAVYGYPDLTGQFKPTETVSTNSRAVTQGAAWMLVKSLKDAAAGRWFKVIERTNLENLLKERQIIRETRSRIENQTGKPQPGLPSLLFAGVILDGGIIGYDSNTVTGGLGARYLGIGGDVQYRQDTVTIYLNAVSSQTGEILKSVMTRKTVVSYGVRGSIFKFVAFQKLLEGETGYTVNEPGQIALAQAIEHAVRSLIIEGALENLWQFEDQVAGKVETQAYLEDKEDNLLLGEASSGVAQALLTDEQLKKINNARKLRRERLAVQKAREQELQIARASTQQAEHQQVTAQIPTMTANPVQQKASAPSAKPKHTWASAPNRPITVVALPAPGTEKHAASPDQAGTITANRAGLERTAVSATRKTPKRTATQPQLVDVSTAGHGHLDTGDGTKPQRQRHYFRPEIKPAYDPGLTIDKNHELREASLNGPNLKRIQGELAPVFSEPKQELANLNVKASRVNTSNPVRDQGEDL